MTRRLVLGPEQVTKIRHDVRYVAARRSDLKTDPTWRARSACLAVDPGTFFPEPQDEVGTAIALCHDCPVSGACLAAALNTAEPEGIWGGTTPSERRAMRVVWTGRC